jgi:uncharacterized membrane protein
VWNALNFRITFAAIVRRRRVLNVAPQIRLDLHSRFCLNNGMLLLLVFAMGFVAGLRSLTPIAVISWAASRKMLNLEGTWMAFLGFRAAPYVASLLALGEIISDKLPKTPSRKEPPAFIFRIIVGVLSGLALTRMSLASGCAGGLGALCGTLGGYEIRKRVVRSLGCPDWPVALAEDAIAIGLAVLIVSNLDSWTS